jgi:hypothetical protein
MKRRHAIRRAAPALLIASFAGVDQSAHAEPSQPTCAEGGEFPGHQIPIEETCNERFGR